MTHKTRTGNDDNEELKQLLQQNLPPLHDHDLELRRDLWPQLKQRLGREDVHDLAPRHSLRIPWFDWALAALAAAALIFFPGVIPALLYHF
ncbi:MAG TPA: hypothetical protein VGG58_01165 [Candidatus Acidoferrum sp.]|jgi:hypothetical protein